MKKWIVVILALLAMAVIIPWYLIKKQPASAFTADSKIFIIPTDSCTKELVLSRLVADSIIRQPRLFDTWANYKDYWQNIKPGRYKVTKEATIASLVSMLKYGRQEPAMLVLRKLRQPQDFARLVARYTEQDSAQVMQFMANADSLRSLGLDSTNWLGAVIPNTYQVLYTWGTRRVLQKLIDEANSWWAKENRLDKAKARGLTREQVHTLASIVEEETNKAEDRPKVASVYLNRLQRGMPLQADPTVRFARKDFLSNRVLYEHLRFPSPYNTYLNTGLPPGPICTPQPASLQSVLDAPATDYIFFVAHPNLEGGSIFTTNLTDHNRYAREYQDSLRAWLKRKAERQKAAQDSLAKAAKP